MDKKRTYIEANVTGTTVSTKLYGALTSGMVGVPVAFSFDESWIELNKIAVFQGCTTKTRALVESNETTVPYEVLQSSGFELEIGVEGRTADGTIVYPSVMKWVGTIQEGADSSADPGTEPSPTVYDDIMQAIGNLDSLKTKAKESLVAAINEIYERGGGGGGQVDPAYVEQLVDEYLAENPPAPGEKGEKGDPGAPGKDGYTPQKGIDYYTEADKQEMVSAVLAALPTWEGGSY